MTDSILKVYEGNYLAGFGMPTVIITADQVIKATLYSEYFVFIEGENNLFWGGQISVDTNGAPEHVISSEISTAIEEALLQAKTTISLRQAALYREMKIDLWQRDKVDLNERDKVVIARLWRSGKFNQQLKSVKEKSKCEPLQAYISLLEGIKFYSYSEFE